MRGYSEQIVDACGCSVEEAQEVEEIMRSSVRVLGELGAREFRQLARDALGALRILSEGRKVGG